MDGKTWGGTATSAGNAHHLGPRRAAARTLRRAIRIQPAAMHRVDSAAVFSLHEPPASSIEHSSAVVGPDTGTVGVQHELTTKPPVPPGVPPGREAAARPPASRVLGESTVVPPSAPPLKRSARERRPSRKALTMDRGEDAEHDADDDQGPPARKRQASAAHGRASKPPLVGSSGGGARGGSTAGLSSAAKAMLLAKLSPASSTKQQQRGVKPSHPGGGAASAGGSLDMKKQIRRARRKENNAAMRYDTLVERLFATPDMSTLSAQDLSKMFQRDELRKILKTNDISYHREGNRRMNQMKSKMEMADLLVRRTNALPARGTTDPLWLSPPALSTCLPNFPLLNCIACLEEECLTTAFAFFFFLSFFLSCNTDHLDRARQPHPVDRRRRPSWEGGEQPEGSDSGQGGGQGGGGSGGSGGSEGGGGARAGQHAASRSAGSRDWRKWRG
eukprot:SAG22_NODE_2588_length_2410_cov_3.156642_1_plen_446_part_00